MLSYDSAARTVPDMLCFSHLRWDFVYQRPQHLLSRCARERRVFYFEEPIFDAAAPCLEYKLLDRAQVIVPHLPAGADVNSALYGLLRRMMREQAVKNYCAWYYTPLALPFTRQLRPSVTVYDCMDELSAFRFAATELPELERELFARADLVFTGGQSLYEAKRQRHHAVHLFPGSIHYSHFAQARQRLPDPADQAALLHPRLGFVGVIDERFDLNLLAALAREQPVWQFILIGPVVKADPFLLPRAKNIHYLGMKSYQELPFYLSNWDVALLPFARNEATRFTSSTKAPEYLAAGKPVVSTSIRDVVRPYQQLCLVDIADEPQTFATAVERALAQNRAEHAAWLGRVDKFLARNSWDDTWARMNALINARLQEAPSTRAQIA